MESAARTARVDYWPPPAPCRSRRPRIAPRPSADPDLLEVLELATDEELEDLYRTLHGRSLFSPLLKSLMVMAESEGGGEGAAPSGRDALIPTIDRRLRFLAADSASTLRGRWPAYRQVLLMIRDKLGIACSPTLLTNELEAEVFLHLLSQHADAVGAAAAPGAPRTQAAAEYASQGDGGAGAAPRQEAPTLVQRLLAPLRLGQEEVMPAVARLGSALAVSNLQVAVVQKLGLKLACSHVQYEAALHFALSAGTKGVQGSLQGKVAVQVGGGEAAHAPRRAPSMHHAARAYACAPLALTHSRSPAPPACVAGGQGGHHGGRGALRRRPLPAGRAGPHCVGQHRAGAALRVGGHRLVAHRQGRVCPGPDQAAPHLRVQRRRRRWRQHGLTAQRTKDRAARAHGCDAYLAVQPNRSF